MVIDCIESIDCFWQDGHFFNRRKEAFDIRMSYRGSGSMLNNHNVSILVDNLTKMKTTTWLITILTCGLIKMQGAMSLGHYIYWCYKEAKYHVT